MRARPAAGEPRDRRAGHLRRAHGRNARAGARARRDLRRQQGRRVDGMRARDGRRHGARCECGDELADRANTAAPAASRASWRCRRCTAGSSTPAPWQDLVQEFGDAEDMPRADREYFRTLVEGVWHARADARRAPGRAGRPRTEAARSDRARHPAPRALRAQRRAPRCRTGSPSTRRSASPSASAPPTDTSSSTPCWIARHASCARTNTSGPPGSHGADGDRPHRALLPRLRRAARGCAPGHRR